MPVCSVSCGRLSSATPDGGVGCLTLNLAGVFEGCLKNDSSSVQTQHLHVMVTSWGQLRGTLMGALVDMSNSLIQSAANPSKIFLLCVSELENCLHISFYSTYGMYL